MKKIILTLLFSLFFVKPVFALPANPSIQEFSSASTSEWIELVNSSTSTIDLTGYKLRIIPQGGAPVDHDLTGSITKQSLLTFSYTAAIRDAGAAIQLVNPSDEVLHQIIFGDYTGATLTAPTSSQSASYNQTSMEWSVGSPTKGWCNSGSTCPTIADIVTQMGLGGVTTNLGDFTDYTHVTGLYFEKTGKGRITFASEMNFTNQDALSWMENLDSKINMNTAGTITLDADLIKNLMSTQATLTMYSLTLNDPEILVDGAADTGGVVSGLSYNKSTGQLSFTAAHFTTFKAQDKTTSSSSSSLNSINTPTCNSSTPSNAPDLFEVRRGKTSATLYFSPSNGPLDRYFIAYGNKSGEWKFGIEFPETLSNGVLKYTINHLKPNQKYFFTIRAGNNCMPGPWSNIMEVKSTSRTYYRVQK